MKWKPLEYGEPISKSHPWIFYFLGYVTTTKIKLVLVVEDEAVPDVQKNVDDEIKALLVKIHDLYVADLMNPFKEIGKPIVSKRFEDGVQKHVAVFNQTDGMI